MPELITRIQNKIRRSQRLRDVDTIAAIRARNQEYDAVLTRIREAGTADLLFFANGYTHEGGYSLQQNPDEFASLCLYLKEHRPYANYMEIGSASGGACLFLYKEVGFENILSLDNGEHPNAVQQKEHFSQLPNFKQFLGDSHSEAARQFLAENVQGKLDIAFIDGDHTFEGVWQDTQLTLPFCRPGTILIYHDTLACAGVRDTWLKMVRDKIVHPLAEYIGDVKPLGIGIAAVI